MNDNGSGGKCNPRSDGFTLLEVLLAISILAFLVSVVYMSFSTTGRNVEQAEAIRDSTDLARTLIAKVSDDIHNAYCGSLTNGKTVFYGKKQEQETGGKKRRIDSLYLTTLTNWRRPNSKEMDLWEVGYYFKDKPDGNGSMLMRHEKRELSNDVPPLEGGIDYEITDKVAELRLRYRRTRNAPWLDGLGGSTPCTSTSALPIAVEISFTLEDGRIYTTMIDVGITTSLL